MLVSKTILISRIWFVALVIIILSIHCRNYNYECSVTATAPLNYLNIAITDYYTCSYSHYSTIVKTATKTILLLNVVRGDKNKNQDNN